MDMDNSKCFVTPVQLVISKSKKSAANCSKTVKNQCTEKLADVCSKPVSEPSSACKQVPTCSRTTEDPCDPVSDDLTLGKITRNPFFNFLREVRKCHQNESAKEIAVRGAEQWKRMSEKSKAKYIVQAFHTPKKYYRRKSNMSMEEA